FVPWLILGSLFGLVFLRIALIGLGIGLPDLSANAEKQEGDVSQHAQSLQLEYTRHRRANSTREHRRGQHGKPCTPDRSNRSARNGLGSQNGVAPAISSATRRPVAGPSVSPQWAWPKASHNPD